MSAAKKFKARISRKNLLKIYEEKVRFSGAVGLDRVRPKNLERRLPSELDLIIRKVEAGSYRFTAYREKLILKGASSLPRQLSIPTARDRIVLRALSEFLVDVFPEAKHVLPQIVIESLKAELSSGNYSEYAKIDLQRFYPSIPHGLIEKSIRQRIRRPQIKFLIHAAISTQTVPDGKVSDSAQKVSSGVPQGLSVSNTLAEIALQSIDRRFSKIPGIWYRRYVDDILILAPSGQARSTAAQLIFELKGLGLDPHAIEPGSKSKVSTLSDPFSFLGYEINSGRLLIRVESVRRFESSIAKILTAYHYKLGSARNSEDRDRALAYCRWKINIRITGCIFEGRRLGWASYFSQITDVYQLRDVNRTIRKLLERFGLSEKIKPKSLVKAHYEIKKAKSVGSSYIPNLDQLTVPQKREKLAMWLGEQAYIISDELVEIRFAMKIGKAVRDFEHDIVNAS